LDEKVIMPFMPYPDENTKDAVVTHKKIGYCRMVGLVTGISSETKMFATKAVFLAQFVYKTADWFSIGIRDLPLNRTRAANGIK